MTTARPARYVVRPATVADAAPLGEMHVQAWRESYQGVVDQGVLDALDGRARGERWRQWLEQQEAPIRLFVGVDEQGRIVGMVCAGPNRDPDTPAAQELYAINVLAEAKGTGLADALLDAAVGSGSASMWVLQDNPRAHAFYARHGFAPDGSSVYDQQLHAVEVRLVR